MFHWLHTYRGDSKQSMLIPQIFKAPVLHLSLPISRFSLPTSHSPLPGSHFSLPTSHFQVLTSHFPLPTSRFPLPTSPFLLPTSHIWLPTSLFPLFTFHFSHLSSHFSQLRLFPSLVDKCHFAFWVFALLARKRDFLQSTFWSSPQFSVLHVPIIISNWPSSWRTC